MDNKTKDKISNIIDELLIIYEQEDEKLGNLSNGFSETNTIK